MLSFWGLVLHVHKFCVQLVDYQLYRRNRQEKRQWGSRLFRECFDCVELYDGDSAIECSGRRPTRQMS